MLELWQPLREFLVNLITLVVHFALHWSLVIAWVAWWLWGVNWKKAWHVLAEGAWVGVVLLVLLSALVWSELSETPQFWIYLGWTTLLAGSALFCGWLQGYFGWTPQEVEINPAFAGHGHGHDHGHGHGHDHGHDHAPAPAQDHAHHH